MAAVAPRPRPSQSASEFPSPDTRPLPAPTTAPIASRRGTALVTGASGGIGEEFARLLAREGWNLVLVARDAKRLQELGAALRAEHKIDARAVAMDLGEAGAAAKVADTLAAQRISIDFLVNNAGYATYGKFTQTDLPDELRMIQVNCGALVHLTKLLLPPMLSRQKGWVLNVASTAAFQPGPLMAAYFASKAFVLSFSEAIANELEGTGVHVTCLCPGVSESGFLSRERAEESVAAVRRRAIAPALLAAEGYAGALRGTPIVVPGWRNKLLAQASRFLPRRAVAAMMRRLIE